MARFFPTIDKVKRFKVQPTEGEWTLLRFLEQNLDDSFEVYFNPYLNGDRPDVIIMRENYGVLVIEVKDWNLENFAINARKKWIYTPNDSIVKSPLDQVLRYKENLFDLHVPELLHLKILDSRRFSIVGCAVYFHCASQDQLEKMLVYPFQDERKYCDWLKYNIDLIGKDSLTKENFTEILKKRYLISRYPSSLFTTSLYNNFKRILSPSIHQLTDGTGYIYSRRQLSVIHSDRLEQRVRGVFGSGKTTVMAARAVEAYKRALERNSNPRILMLTYNITLKNFIRDKLNQVRENFPWECFVITNYHQFINAELNNLNIDVHCPEDLSEEKKSDYFEQQYYGNVKLFEQHKNRIIKYDAVLIDEIQDYHRSWMEIIKSYFRDPEGDYVLFGDVKQNIYGNPTEAKDVVTNVKGVVTFKYCFRSDFKVRDVALLFQQNIFKEKYELDDFSEDVPVDELALTTEKEGYINYMYLQAENPISTLYKIVRANILNKANDISPNDITILGYTANMLRTFDAYYRYSSRERTSTMIETMEAMYLTHLNKLNQNKVDENSPWFNNISEYFKKKLFPKKKELSVDDLVKLRSRIAVLFTLNDLNSEFNGSFISRLEEECEKIGINLRAFEAFLSFYKEPLTKFKETVYGGNYNYIRDNKKLHFEMNRGMVKISTINSFKGWESEVLFLVIEKKYEKSTYFNQTFDELLYTGLTRCKRHLIVVNLGNEEYDRKIRPIIDANK